jgi:two-component system, cell cycle sensor histidine kinase and response regulator CckA
MGDLAGARLLLVDDEAALLKLMETFLGRFGYEVVSYTSASAALSRFEADPGYFGLVVADLTMPEMSGEQMALRMISLNPQVRVLLCSGYPFDVRSLPEAVRGRFSVLQKPFVPKMLTGSVEELLKRRIAVSS